MAHETEKAQEGWDRGIPAEILTKVFYYLDKECINTVRMVCKRWLDLSQDYWSFGRKLHVNVVVVGPQGSGKSCLVGRLLYDMGEISRKELQKAEEEAKLWGRSYMKWAFLADPVKDEKKLGQTLTIHRKRVQLRDHFVTFVDTPGSVRYIKNMIAGVNQADHALLVVPGDMKTLLREQEVIKQQIIVLKVSGIKRVIVAVNQMDNMYSMLASVAGTARSKEDLQNEFTCACELISEWMTKKEIPKNAYCFIPTAGQVGDNLKSPFTCEEMSWWTGPTLAQAITELPMPNRRLNKPLRIPIDHKYRVLGVGTVLTGMVLQGVVYEGQWVKLGPVGHVTQIKSIHLSVPKFPVQVGFPGDHVALCIRNLTSREVGTHVRKDGIIMGFLKEGEHTVSVAQKMQEMDRIRKMSAAQREVEYLKRYKDGPMYPVSRFQAKIVFFKGISDKVKQGYQPTLHVHNSQVPIKFEKILKIEKVSPSSTSTQRTEDRNYLIQGDIAVVEFKPAKELSIDTTDRCTKLARFILREGFKVVGAGVVLKTDYTII